MQRRQFSSAQRDEESDRLLPSRDYRNSSLICGAGSRIVTRRPLRPFAVGQVGNLEGGLQSARGLSPAKPAKSRPSSSAARPRFLALETHPKGPPVAQAALPLSQQLAVGFRPCAGIPLGAYGGANRFTPPVTHLRKKTAPRLSPFFNHLQPLRRRSVPCVKPPRC
jgi:hypothetical protein